MMRRILKGLGITLGVIAGLILTAIVTITILGNAELYKSVEVPTESIDIPADAKSLQDGEHFARVYGCSECHGENYGGGVVIFDEPALGRVITANLTSGKGGIGATYTDEDWVRVLRHGVKPDGTRVMVMPSQELTHFNAETLGKLIAYLKSVPPVDNEVPITELRVVGHVLLLSGQINIFPYDFIDHSSPMSANVTPGPTAEYGEYLAQFCTSCHGEDFAGGEIDIAPPDAPRARNITPDPAGIGGWTLQEFMHAMRTGETPEGTQLSSLMPYSSYQHMTDDELTALYLYLQTVPAKK